MPVMPAGVRPLLRVERFLHFADVAAEAVDHLRDDVVGTDAKAVVEELGGEVAVAEVPGEADEGGGVGGGDLQQGFGRGGDA